MTCKSVSVPTIMTGNFTIASAVETIIVPQLAWHSILVISIICMLLLDKNAALVEVVGTISSNMILLFRDTLLGSLLCSDTLV